MGQDQECGPQGLAASVEAFTPAPSLPAALAGRDRFNALVANLCFRCRVSPPRKHRHPHHTDPDLCEACDEAIAGVDFLF